LATRQAVQTEGRRGNQNFDRSDAMAVTHRRVPPRGPELIYGRLLPFVAAICTYESRLVATDRSADTQ
jgi:hypothetical protein